MKNWFASLRSLLCWLYPEPGLGNEESRMMRPFFWMVILAQVFLYGQSIYFWPHLRQPTQLILFTGLMLLHSFLHWNFPRYCFDTRRATIYFVFQAALAFVITLIGSNVGLVYGLYMGLIGEIVGLLGINRLAVALTTLCLTLSAIGFGFVEGWIKLLTWLLMITPTAFFVIVYVALFHRQMEARERAQVLLRDLETAHRQLAEYADQVEDLTITNERQRMARELHDTLSQGLAGLILQLEAADAHLAGDHPDRARAILQQAMARAREALSDARRAIGDLRQLPAPPSDLADAVREEAARFQSATGIPCQVDLALPPALPETVREHALRAVAEGLTNIARHAQARQSWVRLAKADDALRIEIRDDGCGFDSQAGVGQAGHYGLLGMRERARLLGGKLEIDSAPGQGTRLELLLPLNARSREGEKTSQEATEGL